LQFVLQKESESTRKYYKVLESIRKCYRSTRKLSELPVQQYGFELPVLRRPHAFYKSAVTNGDPSEARE